MNIKQRRLNQELKKIIIQSSIIKIDECTFSECELMKSIEFEENSNLSVICNKYFAYFEIESLNLPSNLISIDKFGFFHSTKLVSLNFHRNCKIKTNDPAAFLNTMIKNLNKFLQVKL